MSKEFETVSFRIEKSKKAELDSLAKAMERDRSYILNQAVADFIAFNRWQIERIEQGMAAAEAGDFATEEEMAAAIAKWRR